MADDKTPPEQLSLFDSPAIDDDEETTWWSGALVVEPRYGAEPRAPHDRRRAGGEVMTQAPGR